jgi:hypothetical protein
MKPIRFRPVHATAAMLFVCVTLVLPAKARADDWVKLGSTTFGSKTDTNDITVSAVRGKFSAIKLSAEDADAKIDQIVIYLSNGTDTTRNVRDKVEKGKETRPIALSMQDNVSIKKISVKASSDSNQKTQITAWGKRD